MELNDMSCRQDVSSFSHSSGFISKFFSNCESDSSSVSVSENESFSYDLVIDRKYHQAASRKVLS